MDDTFQVQVGMGLDPDTLTPVVLLILGSDEGEEFDTHIPLGDAKLSAMIAQAIAKASIRASVLEEELEDVTTAEEAEQVMVRAGLRNSAPFN